MKIKYEESITNIYNENNELEKTITVKTSILVPEVNEAIRNKITGEVLDGIVGVGTMDNVENYEPIEVEREHIEVEEVCGEANPIEE